jgi:hypothetical protein
MPPAPEQRLQESLAQAKWRVDFRRSLLDSHRLTPRVGTEWARREQDLLFDLERARNQLRALEHRELPLV